MFTVFRASEALAAFERALPPRIARFEGRALAEVVKQRRELRQQANILGGMPVVFVVASQYVAHGGVCRYCPFGIEAAGVADDPQQLAVVPATYPVTGHGGVFARCLA